MKVDRDAILGRLAEAWLLFSLGEISAVEALGRVTTAVEDGTGTPCVVEPLLLPPVSSPGVAAASATGVRRVDVVLATPDGASVGRLGVFAPTASLDTALVAGVAARIATPATVPERPHILHEINNRIAALLANVELLEMLFDGQSPGAALLADAPVDHRRDALSAIVNVADVARSLASLAKRTTPKR